MNYCIIQARLNSRRLPGKVLLPICGKPVLQHIIERVRYSKIDKIIVATSTNPENDAIENLCNQLDVPCFRGSEDDVLERFKGTIKAFGIKPDDNIVRITGDCPFIDPCLLDSMLSLDDTPDLITNCIGRTYPDGLDIEIFKVKLLYHPNFSEINFFEIDYSLDFLFNKNFIVHAVINPSHLRWTLDTAEDFEFIKGVYERLYKPGKIFYMEDILNETMSRDGKLGTKIRIEKL